MSSLIFTNHVRDRLYQRAMSVSQVEQTFHSPDHKFSGKEQGTTVFEKRFGAQRVTLIAKQNERYEWIAISVWIDPPNPGTQDAKRRDLWKKYNKAGFWGKWWITLRKILGI